MNHPAEPALRVPTDGPAAHRPWRRWRRSVAALGAALLVAACGGSTEQYDPFVPQRLFSLGDETSALSDGTTAPRGANWSVNGLDGDGNFVCNVLPIWTQTLASLYGFVFPECNPGNVAEPKARTLAVPGAKVADVAIQLAAVVGGLNEQDMVTYLAGTHDVVELYERYPQTDESTLLAEATERGREAARQVNQIVGTGAKVLLAELPDLSYSPYAAAERAAHTDTDRAALIFRLAAAFNVGLETTIILDGRYIGLAQIFQRTQAIGRSPGSYGFTNVNAAVCAVAPPGCTTRTLVADGNANTWLWAGDLTLSYGGQGQLAAMAVDRATRNPF
jgi:hypothetical protein